MSQMNVFSPESIAKRVKPDISEVKSTVAASFTLASQDVAVSAAPEHVEGVSVVDTILGHGFADGPYLDGDW